MSEQSLHHMVESRQQLPIVAEERAYKRFLSVWSRRVRFADGREIDWDVAGHNTHVPTFATVFPFNTKTKTVRVIIEYAQGPNVMTYSLTAGGFDPNKHKDILETAQHELSEEARLHNGVWIRLIPDDHDGIPELKWCRNKFVPFLVLDADDDLTPRERDAEENIQVVDLPLDDLQQHILRGLVMLPAVQTTLMATDWLKRNGHL
ncbi:hypothetical protein BC831DRAFT_451250 [Entophlyctis helioformis]|nr:hypothetical protein BC831DRAFT_451250 [Entophlyctis helioformis]